MRAARFDAATNKWALDEVPTPAPGAGELLVRVRAGGVTPTELLWYPTSHTKAGGARGPAVPGHEFAGVVEAIGANAGGFTIGDEVFGMNDWFADGAAAEFCVARPEHLAAKPAALGFADAAVTPIGALTAWQGLFDRAKLKAGERVLIQGGAGSVGAFAVQIAKSAGATVFATASATNAAYLRELGADRAIDYRAPGEPSADRFDVIFDCVGGETLDQSWPLLAPGGRLVTIAADQEASTDERVKAAFFIVEPSGDQLREIAGRIDRGELRVAAGRSFDLSDASIAYQPAVGERGKRVVAVGG